MRTAIYKIANTNNNKLYIGISNNPEARWREHLYYAKRKRNKLYNAMRKYGAGTFKMEVLHWCGSRDAAYELEQFVVEVAETRTHGYNTTPGGRGLGAGEQHPHYGKTRPAETIEKMRLAKIGKKRPQHEKDKIAQTMRKLWEDNPRPPPPSEETRRKIGLAGLGREVTAETRVKISAGLTGYVRPPMTDETKRKLSEIFTGVKHSPEAIEKIRKASTGRKYPSRKPQSAESRAKAAAATSATRTKNAKSVMCVETGEVYQSARLAAKECQVSEALVSMHCNGKMRGGKTKKGLSFRYVK